MGERESLISAIAACGKFPVFAGFDGAIDRIYTLVKSGDGSASGRIGTIGEFAKIIAAAAGKSTNVERLLTEERCGGNAVLCSLAMGSLGQLPTILANVGKPPEKAFAPLAKCGATTYPIGDCNRTDAIEFFDGKIMLTDSKPLRSLTYDSTLAAIGANSLGPLLSSMKAIAFTNWTMTPAGTEIFAKIQRDDLPSVPRSVPILFDIADPARRSDGELEELLNLLAKFAQSHRTILSVNVKEFERISSVSHVAAGDGGSFRCAMEELRSRWPIEWVVHRVDGAECCCRDGYCCAKGFFTGNPHTTTGGGDHFNGGLIFGLLCALPMPLALMVGNAVSGAYVRSGRSPNRTELATFIGNGVTQ
jgi:hypothetical protein